MEFFTSLALICYGLAFSGVLTFAIAYLVRSEFMPYHSLATARAWQDIDPAMQLLLLALMRVIGATSLGLGVSGLLQLYLLFTRDWTLGHLIAFQAFCLIAITPSVAIGLYMRHKTKAPTPIFSGIFIVLLTLTGFVLAWMSGRFA